METIYIREFAVLAETCNFQIAADSLSMSQSALSKHIQKLEDDLNVSLFDRSKKNAVLSENGKIFLKYARELCRIFDECENELAAQNQKENNTLNIGFIRILGQSNLIEDLTDFSILHPNIQTTIFEQNGDQIKARLSSGECDFVFTAKAEEFDSEEFKKTYYKTEHMVVVLPEDHPLANKETIFVEDLKNEKLIEHNTSLEHRIFSKLCEDHNLQPEIVASVSSSSTIMQMVHEGMGISVMSFGCSDQFENYNLVRTTLIPETGFDIFLVYRRKGLSAAQRTFIDYFRNA